MFDPPQFTEPPMEAPAATNSELGAVAAITPPTQRASLTTRPPPPPPPPPLTKGVELLPNGPAPGVVVVSPHPRAAESEGMFNCVVCLQDQDHAAQMVMPCCGNTVESSIKFCRQCIYKIAETGIRGYIGKCPMCPLHFTLSADGLVQVCQESDVPHVCRLCHCERTSVDPDKKLCTLCMLGSEHLFRYECHACHNVQSIPHPLWLYQPLPGEYSVNTWMCYSSDYRAPTTWRVLPEEMKKIPNEVRAVRACVLVYVYKSVRTCVDMCVDVWSGGQDSHRTVTAL
jgi:hypothetical protein